MGIELKPCPFCGGENVAVYDDRGPHFAMCEECHCAGPYVWRVNDEDDGAVERRAVDAWNRRAERSGLFEVGGKTSVTSEDRREAAIRLRGEYRERTCHNFGREEGTNGELYDFACSSCGFCCDVCGPNYCPNCGAKVVEE